MQPAGPPARDARASVHQWDQAGPDSYLMPRFADALPPPRGHPALRLEGRHGRTSLVTGWLPVAPLAQLPMIAENSPAFPPAGTSHKPSGRNLGSVESANASGTPSAMPPAPRTSSE